MRREFGFDPIVSGWDFDILTGDMPGIFDGIQGPVTIAVPAVSGAKPTLPLLSEPSGQDAPGDSSTTATITPGQLTTGDFDFDFDSDWFIFDAVAGNYTLEGFADIGFQLEVSIWNQDSVPVLSVLLEEASDGSTFTGRFQIETAGRYFFAIEAFAENSQLPRTDYAFTLNAPAPDVPGDVSTTETIAPGDTFDTDFTGASDDDWFRVDATAGDLVQIRVDVSVDIAFYDANGGATTPPSYQFVEENGVRFYRFEMPADTLYAGFSPQIGYASTPTPVEVSLQDTTGGSGDIPGDESSTARLLPGVAFSSDLTQGEDDYDFIGLELEAGTGYTIEIQVEPGRGENFAFRITDPTVTVELSDFDATGRATLSLFADTSGVYFFEVGRGVYSDDKLVYTLTLNAQADGVPGDISSTASLTDGVPVATRYDFLGDRDYFRVDVVQGETFVLQVVEPNGTGNTMLFNLEFFDANGDVLTPLTQRTVESQIGIFEFTFDVTGEIFFSQNFADLDVGTELTYTWYQQGDEAGATAATAAALTDLDATGRADFEGDIDWWAFTAEAGEVYDFDVDITSTSFISGSPGYTIVNASGTVVGNDLAIFTPSQSGTYYLVVGDATDSNWGYLSYRINGTRIQDDFGGGAQTQGRIEVGQWTTAEIDYSGDRDSFAFTAQAGETLIFELTTAETFFLAGSIYNAQGAEITSFGTDGLFEYTFSSSGTYYFEVRSDVDGDDYAVRDRSVTVGIYSDQVDDHGGDIASATAINVGSTVQAVTSFNDETRDDLDFFSMTLEAGQTVAVTVTHPSLASPAALGFGIQDGDGTVLLSNVDTEFNILGDTLTFTSTVAQTLYIAVVRTDFDVLGAFEVSVRNVLQTDAAGGDVGGTFGEEWLLGGVGDDTLRGDFHITLDGLEGEIFRAYRAVLGRAPDEAGFNAFLTEMRLGRLTQGDIVEQFVASAEFQATYGDLTTQEFVELAYTNILPDNDDAQGRANYIEAIDGGQLTRAGMILELVNAPEFVVGSGLDSAAFATNVAIDPDQFSVFRIYQAVFGRDPDEGGFLAFVNALQAGALSVEEITAEFVGSAEFQSTYGNLDSAGFVELLFANVLPGNTDTAGREAYRAALESGALTRAEMVAELIESFEFIVNQQADAIRFTRDIYSGSDDILDGGDGNDILFGGRGTDTFVISGGDDVILDFTPGTDLIDLSRYRDVFSGITDIVDDLRPLSVQDGNDLVITFDDGASVRLRGVSLDDLDMTDFRLPDPFFGNEEPPADLEALL